MTTGEFDFKSLARAQSAPGITTPALPAPRAENHVRVISSLEEMRAAVDAVAASAQRLMSIYTPDLEPDLYDQNGFLEIVKRFVLARRFAKVRVLLSDSGHLLRDNNRFIAMGRRLTSCIDIRPAVGGLEAARLRLPDRRRSRHRLPRALGSLGRRRRSQQSAGRPPVPRRVRRDLARQRGRRAGAALRPIKNPRAPMAWKPDVTVAAVVMRDGRFLVVEERISGRLMFNQPAGHLEDRETLLAAVIRETREETAWRFVPRALVGTYLWRNPVNERSFLRFTFCGDVEDHRPDATARQGHRARAVAVAGRIAGAVRAPALAAGHALHR